MTIRQQEDIEVCKYFIPSEYKTISILPIDEQKYLEWSEKGLHKEEIVFGKAPKNGFEMLILGKSRRGLHMEMWEQGVLEGSTPYITLLGGFEGKKRSWLSRKILRKETFEHKLLPRSIVNFMKKEMFKGIDSEVIERAYSLI